VIVPASVPELPPVIVAQPAFELDVQFIVPVPVLLTAKVVVPALVVTGRSAGATDRIG
jgi:hypothetical protein